jgi:hypothetical protein
VRAGGRFAAEIIFRPKIGATGKLAFQIELQHTIDFAGDGMPPCFPRRTSAKQTSFHTLCSVPSISPQSLSDAAGTGGI